MSYEKQTWVTGEIVTADKLNHMEDGIASGGVNSAYISIKKDSSLNSYGSIYFFVGYASLEEHDNHTRWNLCPIDNNNFFYMDGYHFIYRDDKILPKEDNKILCFAYYDDMIDVKCDIEGDAELSEIPGATQNYPYDSWISGFYKVYEITGDCDFTLKYND